MPVEITEKAAARAKVQLAKRGTPDAGVRIGVKGGGCNGLAYVIQYEDRPRPTDHIIEKGGVKFFIDPKSMLFIDGSVFDWVETVMQQGFKILNPKQKSDCGCGESFSV